MYKASMLPIGCVHIKSAGVLQMAKNLNMQAVPAVTGEARRKRADIFDIALHLQAGRTAVVSIIQR